MAVQSIPGFFRKRFHFNRWQILTHVGSWMPLLVMIWDGTHNHLTANPILETTHRTGLTALVLLVLSLACTPASSLFGFKQAIKLRRPLGLYGFFYAGLHFLIFSVVDYGLDLHMILDTINQQRYVLVGLAALLLLIPLAITSTRGWMKRLGKNWKRLHWLVYVIVPLVVIHFIWLVKADIRVPLQYGAVVMVLLVWRIPRVRRYTADFRAKLQVKIQTVMATRSRTVSKALPIDQHTTT